MANNKIINNLFYKNEPNYNNPNRLASWCTSDPSCVSTSAKNLNVGNGVYQIQVEDRVTGTGNIFGPSQELRVSGFNQTSNEVYLNPQFVDEGGYDFHLNAASPYIDQGIALTQTVGAGSGTQIAVQDAFFFSDGRDMVDGDAIQIGTEHATITHVDYENHILTVNKSMSWSANASVSFPYSGEAPDIGQFEY